MLPVGCSTPFPLLMASLPFSSSCHTFLVLIFSLLAPAAASVAATQLHHPHVSTSKHAPRGAHHVVGSTIPPSDRAANEMHRTNNAHAKSKVQVVGRGEEGAGVIQSSPAHPMPTYKQAAAPTPLPEFPTLGPPIVWSFPATPMPPLEGLPPEDMPALPRTGKKHPPPPCQGGPKDGYHRIHHPRLSPPVPSVAAEPAVSPGHLRAPESAPEPTAGGPLSPPYS